MKFYYNGKLVRTSKTHEYHFGILEPKTGKIVSCHGTYEAAQKEHRRPISEAETSIKRCRAAINAIENGKTSFFWKWNNRYLEKVILKGADFAGNNRGEVSTWEGYIEGYNKFIASHRARQIVELEARA